MQCSINHLLSEELTFADWKVVGRRLKLNEQVISDIDREEHTGQGKRDAMFMKWQEREGSSATYRVLVDAFKDLKNKKDAEAVEQFASSLLKGRLCPCTLL